MFISTSCSYILIKEMVNCNVLGNKYNENKAWGLLRDPFVIVALNCLELRALSSV